MSARGPARTNARKGLEHAAVLLGLPSALHVLQLVHLRLGGAYAGLDPSCAVQGGPRDRVRHVAQQPGW